MDATVACLLLVSLVLAAMLLDRRQVQRERQMLLETVLASLMKTQNVLASSLMGASADEYPRVVSAGVADPLGPDGVAAGAMATRAAAFDQIAADVVNQV